MNLTARDKKLLIALGIIVLLVVFIKFLFLPKLNDITTLNADIDTLNNTYAMNMVYKNKAEGIDSDIKILSEKLKDLRAIYPPSINADELLIIFRDIINESELEVTSITFETAKPTNLQPAEKAEAGTTKAEGGTKTNAAAGDAEKQLQEQQQKELNSTINKSLTNGTTSDILNYFYLWGLKSQQAEGNTESVVIPDGKGYSISVKIDAQGTNEQIKAFFSSLSKLKNRAYCKTASIIELSKTQGDASDQKLKLSAEVVLYGIMDKGAGEYYLLPDGKWMPEPAAGKTDIFKAYSGYRVSENGNSGNIEATESSNITQDENPSDIAELGSYDFSVVASAFGGGLAPSVSVYCKNPESSVTYSNPVVYGDNKGTENAEIFIEEKAGKYYCKFRTDHEAYPDKQYNQTFEFVPVGKDLRLVILSSQRGGVEDLAGVNLSIINNTNKNLTYIVKYDDKASPRVKIGKTVGSVNNEQ